LLLTIITLATLKNWGKKRKKKHCPKPKEKRVSTRELHAYVPNLKCHGI
jgi:hypothetical protein